MSEDDWNTKIIAEFRANHGKVGGPFEGATLLLLTTTGAKTGDRRTVPLGYMPDGDRVCVFGSNSGGPKNPDWLYNVMADPEVTVEVGDEEFAARATVITGEERDRLFARGVERVPQFGVYQEQTTRVIPVIALERNA
ncbi:MAG: nitroreductase/quinone reductase family protein [Actinomycetota bacterium]